MARTMLVDGHSIAFRAFYALPPDMQTSSGQPTNAVFGFLSMLLKAVSDYHPDRVVVVFDPAGKTFREEDFPEYKAQRAETPEQFRAQEPLIREVIESLGLLQVEVDGYEADDVIATLAEKAADDGEEVFIVTGDRDSIQLVRDPHVKVVYNRRGITDVVTFDEAGVREKYGVEPSQYVDYAAMRGDPSDNIPGVPGVGEKTAAKLLQKYGSIDGIYEHIDELTPRLRRSFEENRKALERNRELMRLRSDAPVSLRLDGLGPPSPDFKKVEELFSALEFRTLLARARAVFGAEGSETGSDASLEGEVEELEGAELAGHLDALVRQGGSCVVVAREEAAPGRKGAAGRKAIVGVLHEGSFAVAEVERVLEPWERGRRSEPASSHPKKDGARGGDDGFQAALSLLASNNVTKDGHDLVKLARLLGHATLAGVGTDTAVAAYLLNPGVVTDPTLQQVVEEHAGISLGQQRQQVLLVEADAEQLAREARAVARVVPVLRKKLEEAGMLALYEEVERPLVSVLASMEAVGIKVDTDYLKELSDSFGFDARRHEAEVKRLAGEDVNVRSTQQLAKVLFEKLGLQPVKSTKTGYSTDAATLEALRDEHPIVEQILAFRELEKLRTTVDGLAGLVFPDGRLHPHYNQTAAATGRISSENPNVQNVPIRTTLGRQIRKAFVAEADWKLITADYSQIELRVMAHISGDEGLREALREAHDVHSETASHVFGVAVDEVTEEMRRAAKMVNYGLSYGLETYGLAQRLGIENEEAQRIIERYFESFPGVKRYMDEVVAQAKKRGYTETLFGRRRYIPQLRSETYQVRRMGERMAMNAPIQGTAADIIKRAMVRLEERLRSSKMRARQILQVHDELIVEAPEDEVEAASSVLADVMTGAADLAVPLEVELGVGRDWDEAKSEARPWVRA